MDAKTQIYKGQTQEYYRFFMKSGLTWGDVKEMLNYGTGISIHDVNIDNEEITVDNLLKHYDIALNIIKEKLSGRGCKMLAKPSGIAEYITAGQVHSSIQTMTSNDGETLCPAKTENDLKKVVLNRGFYSIEDLKKEIDKQLQLSPEERMAINVGVHGTDASWADLLLWINNNY